MSRLAPAHLISLTEYPNDLGVQAAVIGLGPLNQASVQIGRQADVQVDGLLLHVPSLPRRYYPVAVVATPVLQWYWNSYILQVGNMSRALDLSGKRFGRLVVLQRAGQARNKGVIWECRCDCGKLTTAVASNLKSGNTTSCGCFRTEKKRATATTHGGVGTRVYAVWKSMIQRCTNSNNPSWGRYGGRGILICPEWLDFERFRADMGNPPDGMSLDRIDNDRGYEPSNCRWASSQTQNRNKRSNVVITFQGKAQTLAEWSAELGIAYLTLHSRLKRGSTVEEAFTTPLRRW